MAPCEMEGYVNGIVIRNNGNGTYTLNGTSGSDYSYSHLFYQDLINQGYGGQIQDIPAGEYIYSLELSTPYPGIQIGIDLIDTTQGTEFDHFEATPASTVIFGTNQTYAETSKFTLNYEYRKQLIQFWILYPINSTYTNLTIKPMVRPAYITDTTFYPPTYVNYTKRYFEDWIYPNKNLFDYDKFIELVSFYKGSSYGSSDPNNYGIILYRHTSTGIYTITDIRNSNNSVWYIRLNKYETVILSTIITIANPSGWMEMHAFSLDKSVCYTYKSDVTDIWNKARTKNISLVEGYNECTLTALEDCLVSCVFAIYPGNEADHIPFTHIMLRRAGTSNRFVPYAKSNRELTEIVNGG